MPPLVAHMKRVWTHTKNHAWRSYWYDILTGRGAPFAGRLGIRQVSNWQFSAALEECYLLHSMISILKVDFSIPEIAFCQCRQWAKYSFAIQLRILGRPLPVLITSIDSRIDPMNSALSS